MADKHLTELEWKRFAKGKGYKDAALAQAMARLEAAKSPAEQVESLAELEKQSQALRKAHKGDKELAGFLDELDKTLASRLTAAKGAAKAEDAKAARSSKGGNGAAEAAGEEDEGPASLTTGLATMLKLVMKDVPMHAMVLTDGKVYGVMLSKRAIAPARSKLLKEFLELGSAKPPILAECVFEANAITFVVAQEVAGLAKKIKGALLAQTERRWKVRVRGPSGEVDEDLAEGDQAIAEAAAAAEIVPQAPPEAPPAPPEAPPKAPPQAPAEAGVDLARLIAAMNKLSPAIKAAVVAHPARAQEIVKAVAAFQTAVKTSDPTAAKAALLGVNALLTSLQPAAGEGAPGTPPPEVVAALATKAAKLAAAKRPDAPPRTALSDKLAADIAARPLPERLADLPGQVAEMVPAFLMSMTSELAQTSKPLASGAPLEKQDQMLGMADTLNAAMRSLRKWEQLVGQGETAGRRLDELERLKAQGDVEAEVEADGVLATYNAARAAGLEEQARTQRLVQTLRDEYQALQSAEATA